MNYIMIRTEVGQLKHCVSAVTMTTHHGVAHVAGYSSVGSTMWAVHHNPVFFSYNYNYNYDFWLKPHSWLYHTASLHDALCLSSTQYVHSSLTDVILKAYHLLISCWLCNLLPVCIVFHFDCFQFFLMFSSCRNLLVVYTFSIGAVGLLNVVKW